MHESKTGSKSSGLALTTYHLPCVIFVWPYSCGAGCPLDGVKETDTHALESLPKRLAMRSIVDGGRNIKH